MKISQEQNLSSVISFDLSDDEFLNIKNHFFLHNVWSEQKLDTFLIKTIETIANEQNFTNPIHLDIQKNLLKNNFFKNKNIKTKKISIFDIIDIEFSYFYKNKNLLTYFEKEWTGFSPKNFLYLNQNLMQENIQQIPFLNYFIQLPSISLDYVFFYLNSRKDIDQTSLFNQFLFDNKKTSISEEILNKINNSCITNILNADSLSVNFLNFTHFLSKNWIKLEQDYQQILQNKLLLCFSKIHENITSSKLLFEKSTHQNIDEIKIFIDYITTETNIKSKDNKDKKIKI